MRRALLLAAALFALSAPAEAQRRPNQRPEPAMPAEPTARSEAEVVAAFCERLLQGIVEAEQGLRQMALTVNAMGRTEPPGIMLTRAAWMDHWVGRLSALIEAGVPHSCVDDTRLETLRMVAARYAAFAAQAREIAQRPPEPAPEPPARVTRRRQQREDQRQELEQQQSLLP